MDPPDRTRWATKALTFFLQETLEKASDGSRQTATLNERGVADARGVIPDCPRATGLAVMIREIMPSLADGVTLRAEGVMMDELR
jgi:hypothetical protein